MTNRITWKTARLVVVVVIIGMLSGASAGALLALTRDLPQIRSLEDFQPSAVTRVWSADGQQLAEFFIQKRDPVPLHQIPKDLQKALLTTEDRRFYEHSGIALRGILRAVFRNLRHGRFAEGASTITQQLAKTLFLTPRKTLTRKLKEAILALQLERRYTKEELLTLYLNQVYFGSGAYGVASAARRFFGKSIQDLTLAECALVAGMPKAPSRYSPLVDPELAVKRRNIVLKQMLATHVIDADAYTAAANEPLQLSESSVRHTQAPYFVDYIRPQLEASLGATRLYKGGLTVHTTLVLGWQQAAEQAIRDGLSALRDRRQRNGLDTTQPQAALIAIDVRTGAIVAMVGGSDHQMSPYNRAVSAERQPGSAFKPIVYALAIERGADQNQTIRDAPVAFRIPGRPDDWQPENFSKTYEGDISLRRALAKSKNIPAVRLIDRLGPSATVQFAHRLGIRSQLAPNLSLALGSSTVRLIDLTAAYAVFAGQGRYVKPFGVSKVVDANGDIIWRVAPEKRLSMSRTASAVVTDMLQAVIAEGTGRRAQQLQGPLAGKTGTTDDYRDALFVGYSPTIAAGVWVGNDDYSTLGPGETGSRAALPIWIGFMKTVLADQPQRYFDLPDDVTQQFIDPLTGERVPASATGAVKALLLRRPDGS